MASGSNIHEEDFRTDLEAMLKASRELGPEMDRALVDSFLERQRTALKQSKRVVQRANQSTIMPQPRLGTQLSQVVLRLIAVVATMAVAVMLCAWLLWLVLPFLLLFSLVCMLGIAWMLAGRWGRGERSSYHMAWRQAHGSWRMRRWQVRDDYWHRRYDQSTRPGNYI